MFKGFYSFDALVAMLIVVFLLFFMIGIIRVISYDIYVIEYNKKMEKLFLASEYVVKQKAKSSYKTFVNKLENQDFSEFERQLGERLDLNLKISFEREEGSCIVRYVTINEELRKLFFCFRGEG